MTQNQIKWLNQQEDMWEGIFHSEFFRNEDNEQTLFVCLAHASAADYAQKCVEHLNALPETVLHTICEEIARCAGQKLTDAEEILHDCWFTTLYVPVPEEEQQSTYLLEGEGEWGETIGFVIRNNQLVYVGTDYFEQI